MALKDFQIHTIELLAKQEELLGQLYREYSKKFLVYKKFWLNVSFEEINHAAWIRRFLKKAQEGMVFFNEQRFKIEAINTFSRYVMEQIDALKSNEVSDLNALAIAYDLENTLLENKFFEIFEEDSVEFKHLLLNLSYATKQHREKIKKALEEKKQAKK